MKHFSLILFVALALPAADPPGFVYWPAATLTGYAKTLAPKINAQKVAVEQFGRWGNHSAMVAHREGDGEAEVLGALLARAMQYGSFSTLNTPDPIWGNASVDEIVNARMGALGIV